VTSSRKYRALLVDDEPSLLLTYRLILEQAGYGVVACGSLREAMTALQGQKFDVVLCDYFLEEQHTGFEVVAAARQFDAHVPAAVLTGFAARETYEQAATLDIEVMLKPISIPEFLATISTMLRKNKGPATQHNGEG
jgi:CheY-like chemotaxis protein